MAKNHPLDIAAKSEQGLLVRLGRLIGRIVDRRYHLDGVSVAVKRGGDRAGVAAWHLAEEGVRGDGGDVGDHTRQCARGNGVIGGDWQYPLIPPIPPTNTNRPIGCGGETDDP